MTLERERGRGAPLKVYWRELRYQGRVFGLDTGEEVDPRNSKNGCADASKCAGRFVAGRLVDKGKGAMEEVESRPDFAAMMREEMKNCMESMVMPVVHGFTKTQNKMQETQQQNTTALRGEIQSYPNRL